MTDIRRLVELLGASEGESALKKSIINALLLERSVATAAAGECWGCICCIVVLLLCAMYNICGIPVVPYIVLLFCRENLFLTSNVIISDFRRFCRSQERS